MAEAPKAPTETLAQAALKQRVEDLKTQLSVLPDGPIKVRKVKQLAEVQEELAELGKR